MMNPIHPFDMPIRPPPLAGPVGVTKGPAKTDASGAFKEILLNSLEQVNSLQQAAATEVDGLIRGDSQDVAEVFRAIKKSEVAFSLLMEIRNKLTEAYQEIQQIRF